MGRSAPQPGQPLPGRNEPCWCGSGRKYKQCHWAADDTRLRQGAAASPASSSAAALPHRTPAPAARTDLNGLLQQSAAHHQAGRLHEAELGYRAVLQQDPNNLDALHLLGLIAISAGQPKEGERLIHQAIALNPDFAEARSNLGNLLREQGRAEAALSQLQHAVAIKPSLANAHHNLGIVLNELGRTREAIAEHRLALSLQPDYPETLNSLGNELKQIDALDEAEACFRRALSIRPTYAEAHNGLGIVLHARLQRDAADASFRTAISLRPNFAEAHSNLGLLLLAQDRLHEAETLCRAGLQMKQHYPDGHNNLGIVLHGLHQYEAAEAEYRAALALRPTFVDAMSNLGGALHAQGRMQEADTVCRQAIALRPDHAEAYQKYGVVCVDSRRTEAAIELYRKAIELRPDFALGHWSLSLALLARGQYEEGWAEYEWRFKCAELLLKKPRGNKPQWDGSTFAGQTLLLYGEQGLGDALQFLRYVPLAAERGERVVVLCRAPLRSLVSSIVGVSAVVCEGEVVPPFDLHASLLSLPWIFQTTLQTIPATIPYLSVDPLRRAHWGERVSAVASRKRKIGLVWSGNPDHKNDHLRSCGFAAMEPLSSLQNTVFFSLQKPPGAGQLQAARTRGSSLATAIYDWTDELNDLEDTAALLLSLDVVISIDSAVVHLAGALGVETCVLLALSADWRWLEDRDSSPWYPTARLFRQKSRNDWSSVMRQVVESLEN